MLHRIASRSAPPPPPPPPPPPQLLAHRANASASSRAPRAARPFATLSILLTGNLKQLDPDIFDIIEKEKRRQRDSIVLIPSENFTSPAVLQALGSVMQNKYSEGYPGARYYGGNEFIDMSENACRKRALEVFRLDPKEWGVNVQLLSGTPANFAAYTALLAPHDRIMSLDLPHGGHLSHGYQIAGRKISAVSLFFETLPYRLDESTGLIDYDMMEKVATLYRPKMFVGGASAYSRHIDWERMRKLADVHNAILLGDMAHISGLVAGGVVPSPFDFCHVVTTTTHKSLRGPRGAMIFFRKNFKTKDKAGKEIVIDFEEKINSAVFPGLQGGPHNHTIAALAVALKQAGTPDFREYAQQILKNNKRMCEVLMKMGYKIVSGGTDNHLMLVDLRPKGITGSKVEKVMERVGIALNKNTVPGDISAMNPGGIRIGSPAMTTRGLMEKDFEKIAEFLDRAIRISLEMQEKTTSKKLADYVALPSPASLDALHAEILAFCRQFPTVGFREEDMVYKD